MGSSGEILFAGNVFGGYEILCYTFIIVQLLDKPSLGIQQQIEKGISILKQGGIVAFPTDTVYGLGAGANLPQAIERVYEVKERPRNMALPLLLADVSQITRFTESVPPVAWLLIHNFLPGALTLILSKPSSVPDIITAGGTTIAIRIPAHPVPVALVKGLGTPIVGTSANLSGRPSPLTADEVYSQLGNKVNLIIDGGRCPGGKESTIVDVTGETPVLLREGAISIKGLKKVCGSIVFKEGG
ncbi:L-threonylcarbamoyladenylate synthase [Chloroflexota bacterium]